jgi:hypothetical protein
MDKHSAFADSVAPERVAGLASLIAALRAWLRSLLQLAVLEGREAGLGFALMFALGAAAAALLTTGWLALVGAGVAALVEYRILGWTASLLIAALVSFAAAGMLVFFALRRSRNALFCATRRQLGLRSGHAPAPPTDHA